MVKLVYGLHQESPRVVKLEVELHHGCSGGHHRSPGVVKLVMGLHHQRCKKMKFMMELHYRSPKEREASVGASP